MINPIPLVPEWTRRGSSHLVPNSFSRSVLIQAASPPMALHGELEDLRTATARIVPDVPILIRTTVQVEVHFRFDDAIYFLSGSMKPDAASDDLLLEFDHISRRQSSTLRDRLQSLGLLSKQEQAMEAAFVRPTSQTPKPEDNPRPAKADIRRVCRIPPPGGIERRIHRRHELGAPATLLLVEDGMVFKCELLELSQGGCRVYSEFPVSLPESVQLEMDFIGRGIPFRVATMVRENRNGHVLGMQFQNMSERIRVRLTELLEELRAEELLIQP